jgi:uncharacterized protein YodC (DUF2158 family)
MADEIKIGETVQLKSGDPVMTISNIDKLGSNPSGPDHAWCDWFDGKKQMNGVFPVTSLTLA